MEVLVLITFIDLGINTFYDLKYRKISVICCSLCAVAAVPVRILLLHQGVWDIAPALLPGLFLALTVLISDGKVGMGDALVFLSLGCIMDVMAVVAAMFLGMCMSGVFSLGALSLGRVSLKSRLPMMPFVIAAYSLVLVMRCSYG